MSAPDWLAAGAGAAGSLVTWIGLVAARVGPSLAWPCLTWCILPLPSYQHYFVYPLAVTEIDP